MFVRVIPVPKIPFKSENKSFAFLAILYTTSARFTRSRILNSPDCIILDNRVFENLILADEPFAKALQIFETCVSVNNSLHGKLV